MNGMRWSQMIMSIKLTQDAYSPLKSATLCSFVSALSHRAILLIVFSRWMHDDILNNGASHFFISPHPCASSTPDNRYN